MRTAVSRMVLATHGGAPSYDYEDFSNKVAHLRFLSSFPCAHIRASAETVKRRTPLRESIADDMSGLANGRVRPDGNTICPPNSDDLFNPGNIDFRILPGYKNV